MRQAEIRLLQAYLNALESMTSRAQFPAEKPNARGVQIDVVPADIVLECVGELFSALADIEAEEDQE